VWDADGRGDWDRSPAEAPVLLVLAERAGGAWDALEAALEAVAAEAAAAPPPVPPSRPSAPPRAAGYTPRRPVFMLARERQGLGLAVRRLARLGDAGARPQAVLLDMSADGTFYTFDAQKDITEASLRAFLAAYAAGALPPQRSGMVPTLTVTAALTHQARGADGEEDVNLCEALVNCLLCPITCPLMCAFQCCLGCCMFSALGAAMAGASMNGARPMPAYQ
jgi:hypothetical protein